MHESTSLPSWIEAAGSALAVVLSVISMGMSVRTDKRARVGQQLLLRQKNLQDLVDRIETIDKASLSSPGSSVSQLQLIVAGKTQEYEALFSVYKQYLPRAARQTLSDNLASINHLQKAAVSAVQAKSADSNKIASEYFDAMANFVVDFKRESTASLEQASDELAKLA
jgi:hypothetical protein